MRDDGQRQSSGALIFPVSPQELKSEKLTKDLEQELEEVRKLKDELITLIKENKK